MIEDDDDWLDEPEDGDLTAPCPHCGGSIYDDSERCPSCGAYLSREDAPRRKPLWIVLGVLVGLGLVWTWNFGR